MIMHDRYFRAWVFDFVLRSFIRLISMIEVMPTCSSVDLGFERAGLCVKIGAWQILCYFTNESKFQIS